MRPTTMPVVSAGDAYLTVTSPGCLRIGTAVRALEISVDDDAAAELRRLIRDVLPRFALPTPPQEELDRADLSLFTKYYELIERLQLVYVPEASALERMTTAAHSELYGFLARRSAIADEIFISVRQQPVVLHGPRAYVNSLLPLLTEQGLDVVVGVDWSPGDPPPQASNRQGITVVVAMLADEAALAAGTGLRPVNQAFLEAEERWVPLLITPRLVRVGPWTSPRESACLTCLTRTQVSATQVPPAPVPTVGTPWRAWSSVQPSTLHWTAGLLAHLLLRVMAPSGPNHPWGSIFTLDAERLRQDVSRVWMDPACPDCDIAHLRTPAWRPA